MSTPIAVPSVATLQGLGTGVAAALAIAANASGGILKQGAPQLTLTGGTITADAPPLNITQTWNNAAGAFNGILANFTKAAIASDATSFPFNVQVGGTTMLRVNARGDARVARSINLGGSCMLLTAGGADRFVIFLGDEATATASVSSFYLNNGGKEQVNRSDYVIGFSSSATDVVNNAIDAGIRRDAADIIAMRRSTNPQAMRWYNTYTSGSNFERSFARWASNVFEIGTETTGGSNRALSLISASGLINVSGYLAVTASTTARPHLNLASGVAPSSPANGDIWFDGTDLKIRSGGTTYTFTKT